jgi:hypothetical protein
MKSLPSRARALPPARAKLGFSGISAVIQGTTARFDPVRCGCYYQSAGWSSPVARWAHNPKVPGSNPGPATNQISNLDHFSRLPCPTIQFQTAIGRNYDPSAETSTPKPPLGTTRWTGLRGTFRLALSGAAALWLLLTVETFA